MSFNWDGKQSRVGKHIHVASQVVDDSTAANAFSGGGGGFVSPVTDGPATAEVALAAVEGGPTRSTLRGSEVGVGEASIEADALPIIEMRILDAADKERASLIMNTSQTSIAHATAAEALSASINLQDGYVALFTDDLAGNQFGIAVSTVAAHFGPSTDYPAIRTGFVDPSAGAGVAAPEGSLYLKNAAGAGQLWLKTGATDTGWSQIT